MIERRRRGRGVREEKEEGYLKKRRLSEKKIMVFLFCPYVNCKREEKKGNKKKRLRLKLRFRCIVNR